MNRLRMATVAALAGLGLLSGCQSSRNGCDNGGGLFHREGGLMSRLGLRRNGNGHCNGVVVGTPVSAAPSCGGEACPGPIHEGPIHGGPILDGHPGATTFPEGVPPISTGPGPLPHPMPVGPGPTPLGAGPPPLAPVPNGGGLAPETPAPPSTGMSRRRQ